MPPCDVYAPTQKDFKDLRGVSLQKEFDQGANTATDISVHTCKRGCDCRDNAEFLDLTAEHQKSEAEHTKQDLIQWTLQLDDAETCNNVAWEIAKLRDTANSMELSSCALRLSPGEPNYHDTRGLVFALSGKARRG